MRLTFKLLTRKSRQALLERVLIIINRKHKERDCLRNLLTDAASNEETIKKIVDYLIEHGYPQTDATRWRIGSIIEWKRQSGQIRIPNPSFLLSVQRVKTLLTYLNKSSTASDSIIYGIDFSDMEMEGKQFRKQLLSAKEKIEANKKNYPRDPTKIQLLRIPADQNIWVTWNEKDPSIKPDLDKFENDKMELFRILGLGFNINYPGDHFIALCFEIKDCTDVVLYRTGWGDATTYSYWESIKDTEAKYGYTKPIDRNASLGQPEAVSENHNFYIERLSAFTFGLKLAGT